MSERGREEAMNRWLRQREIGDVEDELERATSSEERKRLTARLERLRAEDQPGPRPAETLL